MSQSQSIILVKQKPDNNCQTARIVTISFVHFFGSSGQWISKKWLFKILLGVKATFLFLEHILDSYINIIIVFIWYPTFLQLEYNKILISYVFYLLYIMNT